MRTLLIMISGRGSNMEKILQSKPRVDKIVVLSNNKNAMGVEIARNYGCKVIIVDRKGFETREDFDKELLRVVKQETPTLIALAGFMHILNSQFVNEFPQRIINIHPSLLPKYKGLNTHKRVLEDKTTVHGCTVHFVNENLDDGELIAQIVIDVHPKDTPEILEKRVLKQEHILYPRVIKGLLEEEYYS